MKYVVRVRRIEYLFEATETGLNRAKEFANAIHSNVILESYGQKEIVFRSENKTN